MRRQSKPMNASRRMIIDPLYEFEEELQRLIVKTHLEIRGGEVTGPIEGTYGDVYSITLPENTSPRRIAAKCPRIKRFGTSEQARSGIEQVLHELEKTHRAFMVPWINRFFDVQIIHGWPFLLSVFRDGSLEDLISNPLAWTVSDRLASLILVARALRLASDRGITAHQDLKPGNVFFDDLARTFGVPKGSSGMHFRIFVGDFGLADAFRDFGRNQGSRPYMAPEQFDVEVADPASAPAFDVFALAVIACESFLDGRHPSGVVTRDCWPWQRGMAQKWNRESTWREWAKFRDKTLPEPADRFPPGVYELLLRSLAVDARNRPSLLSFEDGLWAALAATDPNTENGLRMQIEYIEGLSITDTEWPHMDERLSQLREFYGST
jgi:serine/threonine protein kinase